MENQVASYGPKAGLNSKDTICLKLVLSKTIKGRMEERKSRDFVYHGWEVPILVCSPLVGNSYGNLPLQPNENYVAEVEATVLSKNTGCW